MPASLATVAARKVFKVVHSKGVGMHKGRRMCCYASSPSSRNPPTCTCRRLAAFASSLALLLALALFLVLPPPPPSGLLLTGPCSAIAHRLLRRIIELWRRVPSGSGFASSRLASPSVTTFGWALHGTLAAPPLCRQCRRLQVAICDAFIR